jgi:hypothetical protein
MARWRANGFPVLRIGRAWRRWCTWRYWVTRAHMSHSLGEPILVLLPQRVRSVHPDYLTDSSTSTTEPDQGLPRHESIRHHHPAA